MNIYIVTIMGNRFYFYGELSEEECKIVEEICKRISSDRIETDVENKIKLFQKMLESSIAEKIKLVKVKHVFRI